MTGVTGGADGDCILLLQVESDGLSQVSGGSGEDCIQVTNSVDIDSVSGGGDENDFIFMSASDIRFVFGGSDYIETKDGTTIQTTLGGGLTPNQFYVIDTVVGGSLSMGDSIYAKNSFVGGDITGSTGNDVIELIEVTVTGSGGVVGNAGDDVISASRTDVDIINGGPGNDKLFNVFPMISQGSALALLNGGDDMDLCVFDSSQMSVNSQNCEEFWDPICL
mmetsp:Transcript_15574/g.17312  ORF Transcript_15574/g.17312 Transcript_15574/m.17312 type:complete len:221 (+) Transcript_15574:550-1212(+)